MLMSEYYSARTKHDPYLDQSDGMWDTIRPEQDRVSCHLLIRKIKSLTVQSTPTDMMTEYPRPTAKISPANWRSSYSADPFESVRTLSTLVSKSESVPLPKSMGSQARIFDCNAQTLCEDNVSTSQMTINRTFSPIRPMKCGRSANNASTSPLNSRTSNILVHSSETGPLNPTGRRDEILFSNCCTNKQTTYPAHRIPHPPQE